jgi:hypothetical protein
MQTRQSMLSNCIQLYRAVLVMVLTVALGIIPLVPAFAQNSTPTLALLTLHHTSLKGQVRPTDTLLYLLKHVEPNFTTISVAELTNFKGNTVVVPLDNRVEPQELSELLKLKEKYHFIFMPILHQSAPQTEEFLQAFGFPLSGSQFAALSFRFKMQDKLGQSVLPIGSHVFTVKPGTNILATWNGALPAAIQQDRGLLLNWNWARPFAQEDFQSILHQMNQPQVASEVHPVVDVQQAPTQVPQVMLPLQVAPTTAVPPTAQVSSKTAADVGES